jgi:hypothetical protein
MGTRNGPHQIDVALENLQVVARLHRKLCFAIVHLDHEARGVQSLGLAEDLEKAALCPLRELD